MGLKLNREARRVGATAAESDMVTPDDSDPSSEGPGEQSPSPAPAQAEARRSVVQVAETPAKKNSVGSKLARRSLS